MEKSEREVLIGLCMDYMRKHGGPALLKLVLSVKDSVREEVTLKVSATSTLDELLSLEQENEDGASLMDTLVSENPRPDEVAENQSTLRVIDELLKTLSPLDQSVICMRYGFRGHFPHTLEETWKTAGVTQVFVRTAEQKMIRRFRRMVREKGLQESFF